jgi:hypothetical protein
LQPGIPRDLETICLKCLHKETWGRYFAGAALADDLQRFLAGEPIRARATGRLEALGKWVRRRPALAGVYGLALLAGALGSLAGSAAWLWLRADWAYGQAVQAQQQAMDALGRETLAREGEQKARDDLDRFLYYRRVSLALAQWKDTEVARARQLLEECPTSRRGWEWDYVHRLCYPGPITSPDTPARSPAWPSVPTANTWPALPGTPR